MSTQPQPPTKKTKIKRVLRSAARLPRARMGMPALKAGRGSGRNDFSPRPGEPPVVVFRLQVLGCASLLAKDRGGTSDPFVVVSVLNNRQQTPVSKRTVNPIYAAKDATFDFPLYLSLADRLGVVELVVWDKDMLRKEYLGEVAIPLEDWFVDRDRDYNSERDAEVVFGFDQPGNKPFSLNLVSSRANTRSTGSIQVKLGFAPTPNAQNLMEFDEIYGELVKRSRPSLVSAPPTEGVGTIRSHHGGHHVHYQDDGGLSSDEDDSDDEPESDSTPTTNTISDPLSSPQTQTQPPSVSPKPLLDIYIPPSSDIDLTMPLAIPPSLPPPSSEAPNAPAAARPGPVRPAFQLPELHILPSSPATPTPGNLPTAVPRLRREGVGHTEETPRAGAGFALPATHTPGQSQAQAAPASSGSGSRFIPKTFVRRFSGLTGSGSGSGSNGGSNGGVGPAPASPGVDMQGNLVPPSPGAGGKNDKSKRSASGERRKFGRSWSGGGGSGSGSVSPSGSASGSDTGGGVVGTGVGATGGKVGRMRRKKKDYEFKGANDIVGIVMLEIQGADDLPRLANMTRTGWDMDPFVVISFGKKVFRTRVIRHSRNPVWDEKLLFHVRRYETSYKVQLTVLDWDKLSSNDHIGDVTFDVETLIDGVAQPDPETGLYDFGDDLGNPNGGQEEGMKDFQLRLETTKEMPWEAKHNPTICFRARYQPYSALRQRFWRQYLSQYDTDNTSAISHLELSAMLDSLGSTLTRSTVATFFTRYGKDPNVDEISIPEAVRCLEEELGRPVEEKRRLDADEGESMSASATPVMMVAGEKGEELGLRLDLDLDFGKMDFSGPAYVGTGVDNGMGDMGSGEVVVVGGGEYTTEPMQMPLVQAAHVGLGVGLETPDSSSDDNDVDLSSSGTPPLGVPATSGKPSGGKRYKKIRFRRALKKGSGSSQADAQPLTPTTPTTPNLNDDSSSPEHNPIERVINVKNCPLCHRPRLNSKAEMDIVTHLAICASQDWAKVDRIVVGNFVTASQAQRKWYTRVLGKVSSGDYRLGANSANIIVQNRMTGQLEEEKMQVYVRLGIRLLYKGASSRMEGGRARRLLKSLSIKQGIKYDDPESAKEIPTFIQFHRLKVEEILDPIDSFKTFNQFFYRKLKPSARPVESTTDPYRLVSAADCRLMAFETVSEATRLWIKGREFTVARLLGERYASQAANYAGGALLIFRLAPQDYHRFHSPVEGRIGEMTEIAGEYYTVNPQAIRTALDVYGENVRKIVPIDSPHFGRVMAVCVGAMMVGSIKTTVEEGEYVQRGQEFGYFAFGGSTIVILFEKGRVEWDEDLLINGRASLETLVRVGMGIGRGRPHSGSVPTTPVEA